MKTKQYIPIAFTLTLLLLWIPVAIEKLFDFDTFKYAILRQPLPYTLTYMAVYILPALELLAVILLVFPQWRQAGFLLSTVLMAIFTAYIGLALLGTWDRLPCGCGSVIKGMTWAQHMWFNLFFLGVSVAGVKLEGMGGRVMSDEVRRTRIIAISTANPGDQVMGCRACRPEDTDILKIVFC